MFRFSNTPIAELYDGALVRRAGWFFKKQIRLNDIQRVVAVNRDAITHEEVMIGFLGSEGTEVWLSEFDKNFSVVIEALSRTLPGFDGFDGLASQKPFERIERVLWIRSH